MRLLEGLSIVLLLITTGRCLTIRKESVQSVWRDKSLDKGKSKKSVETLYTIENDFNRNHLYIHRGSDGYDYYVPEKGVKPVVEEVEEVLPVQHDHHNYQNSVLTDAPQSQSFHEQQKALHASVAANPLLAALVVSQTLGIPPAAAAGGFNHPAHLPTNPYVALLLSHYGRYIRPAAAIGRHQRGIYGYAAANNYHNNKPFGAYKIHEDAK